MDTNIYGFYIARISYIYARKRRSKIGRILSYVQMSLRD